MAFQQTEAWLLLLAGVLPIVDSAYEDDALTRGKKKSGLSTLL